MNDAEQIYQALFQRWGKQHWWPAESSLEIILSAILTQNTNWKNVEKAIQRLKNEQAIDISRLASVSTSMLEEWIRPAGFFDKKHEPFKPYLNVSSNTSTAPSMSSSN